MFSPTVPLHSWLVPKQKEDGKGDGGGKGIQTMASRKQREKKRARDENIPFFQVMPPPRYTYKCKTLGDLLDLNPNILFLTPKRVMSV